MHVTGGTRTASVRTPSAGRMFHHIPHSRMVGS